MPPFRSRCVSYATDASRMSTAYWSGRAVSWAGDRLPAQAGDRSQFGCGSAALCNIEAIPSCGPALISGTNPIAGAPRSPAPTSNLQAERLAQVHALDFRVAAQRFRAAGAENLPV